MTATLNYSLPEEEVEFRTAANAMALRAAVQEFDNWLRGIVKHGSALMATPEIIRARLHEELTNHNIDLHE